MLKLRFEAGLYEAGKDGAVCLDDSVPVRDFRGSTRMALES